jgi:hypothetical protein
LVFSEETFLFANIIQLINLSTMAKVVAPLGSFSASGKIGKALVFFSHLGRNVVRGLVTPANPQSETQGDSRLLLGALGRSSKGVSNPSDYYTQITAVVPAGQTWVSAMISSSIDFFGSGVTGTAALVAAGDGQAATNWEAQAALVGLTDVTISYAAAATQTISAGNQLYALARRAIEIRASNPTVFNSAPYTTALASWDSADVVSHVAFLNSVA